MKILKIIEENQWIVDTISTVVLPISLGVVLYDPEFTDKTQKIIKTTWGHLWYLCIFLLVASSIVLAVSKYYHYKSKDTITKLRAELKSCKEIFDRTLFIEIFTGYLYALSSEKLCFGAKGENSERITLYIHDNSKDSFIPFSRVSQNPLYKKKGRPEYPDDIGCIGKAWENGWHFDNCFPEEKDEYAKYCKNGYGMNHGVTNSLAMKSKLFACLRIEGEGDPLGLIVVESMIADRYQEDDIKKF